MRKTGLDASFKTTESERAVEVRIILPKEGVKTDSPDDCKQGADMV